MLIGLNKPMSKHLVLPDTQIKPGVPLDHIGWAAQYVVDKKPDVIVMIGDWADMCSLSSYDVGKKDFEGRTYAADIEVSNDALADFMRPIEKERARLSRNKEKRWNPRKIFLLGNHENRINKAINTDRKLEGLISTDDLLFKENGWEVYDFLQPVIIDGVAYCHYFVTGVMGRPVTSARALTQKKHMSCTMGHVQNTEIDMSSVRADGTPIIGLFAGCFTLHDEDYLGPQGNPVHRQIWMKHEVENGMYYPMPVSINYLRERYGSR